MTRKIFAMTGKLTTLSAALLLANAPAAHAAEEPTRTIEFKCCAKPHYPQADLEAKHEGTVTLGFKADAQGQIVASKVLKSSGHQGLDEEARTALAKCKFSPAEAGVKYAEWTRVQYVWTLN